MYPSKFPSSQKKMKLNTITSLTPCPKTINKKGSNKNGAGLPTSPKLLYTIIYSG